MEILPQILLIALISSAIYALLAAGLTLTFGTLEFINFAHGDMAMIGAYSFFSAYVIFGLPLIASLTIMIVFMALLGLLIEKTTFKPVRDKQEFIPLVLSIGVAIILQAFVTMRFGGSSQSYYQNAESSQIFRLFDGQLIVTLPQIMIITVSISLLIGLGLFLKYSKTGKAIRAVSDNKQVAEILGINVDRTLSIVFVLASILAGIAGVLIAFDTSLYPRMGLILGIKVFAAIILGGVGKFWGAILGALIIGFGESLIIGLTSIPGSFKDLIVFTIFISVILFKPYGILGGRKEEIESR